MLGAIIGAGIGAAGQGVSALLSAAARRRADAELRRKEMDNELWYNRRYNEVGSERADAVRALERMRGIQRERMSNVRGRNAVVGGSNSSVASESAASNKSLGDAIGQIDAAQEARKDRIEDRYRSEKGRIRDARMGIANNEIAQYGAAAGAASALGAGIAQGLDGGKSNSVKSENAKSDGVKPKTELTSQNPNTNPEYFEALNAAIRSAFDVDENGRLIRK